MLIKKIQSILELQGGYSIKRRKTNERSVNLYLKQGPIVEIYNTGTVVVRGKGDKQAVMDVLGLGNGIKKVPMRVLEQCATEQSETMIAFPCASEAQKLELLSIGRRLGLESVTLDRKALGFRLAS